jgi:hypothetical protein
LKGIFFLPLKWVNTLLPVPCLETGRFWPWEPQGSSGSPCAVHSPEALQESSSRSWFPREAGSTGKWPTYPMTANKPGASDSGWPTLPSTGSPWPEFRAQQPSRSYLCSGELGVEGSQSPDPRTLLSQWHCCLTSAHVEAN